eukprot:COSAG01_NODE_21354_length_905_cov_3.983871_2_plen_198_part_01
MMAAAPPEGCGWSYDRVGRRRARPERGRIGGRRGEATCTAAAGRPAAAAALHATAICHPSSCVQPPINSRQHLERPHAPHCAGMYGQQQLQVDTGDKDDAAAGAAASPAAQLPRGSSRSSSAAAAATTGPEPEPEKQQQQQQQQQQETGDGFEALGLGPDLHDYRELYRQYLPRPIGTPPPCRAAADSECCCCRCRCV